MHFLIQVPPSIDNHVQHNGNSFKTSKMKRTAKESFYIAISNGYGRLAVACLFFSLSILYYTTTENWNVLDSVLFVVVSASTVGYGNIHPTTTNSRIYTIFLMIFGTFVVYSNLMAYLHNGIVKLNKFLTTRITSRLKRTELLFQRRLILSVVWVLVSAVLGAVIFQTLEDLSFVTALYFSVQTMMTVGYGDVTFHNQSTKIFLIFFIVLSTALLGLAINNIYALIQNRKVLNERRSLLKLQRKLHFLADLNDGRGVDRFEFVLTILQHIGTLDHDKDIAPWLKKFTQLDTDESGFLNQQQLALFSEQHARECETEIEEIEQIALSTSNVESLPVASPSLRLLTRPLALINDLRQRAGLFSDHELFATEEFDSAEGVEMEVDTDIGDAFDAYTDCAVVAENEHEQERFYSPGFRKNVFPSALLGIYGRKYEGTPIKRVRTAVRTPTRQCISGSGQDAKEADGLSSTRSRRCNGSDVMSMSLSPDCAPRYPVPQLHSAKCADKALPGSRADSSGNCAGGKLLHLQSPLSTVPPCCDGAQLTDDAHSPFSSLHPIAMESGSYWDAELHPCPTPRSPTITVHDKEKEGAKEFSLLPPATSHYYDRLIPSAHSSIPDNPADQLVSSSPVTMPDDAHQQPGCQLVPSIRPPHSINKSLAKSSHHCQDTVRFPSPGHCNNNSSSNRHSPTRYCINF